MQLVEVYRARDANDAHLMCGVLNDSGIITRIEGEGLQSIVGEVPVGWVSAPRIIVSDSQAQDAREIIEKFERARQSKG